MTGPMQNRFGKRITQKLGEDLEQVRTLSYSLSPLFKANKVNKLERAIGLLR